MRHPVDLVPRPQSGEAVRAASRAAAFGSEVKLISAGILVAVAAFPAFINGHVAQTLPKVPVNPLDSGTSASATFGHRVIYTPNGLNSSREELYDICRMNLLLIPINPYA